MCPKDLKTGTQADCLYVNAHSKIIHNNHKMDVTPVSTESRVGERNLVHQGKGVLSSLNKERSSDTCCNVGEPRKRAGWHKPGTKNSFCMISLIWGAWARRVHRDEIRSEVTGPGWRRAGKLLLNGYRVPTWEEGTISETDTGNGCPILWTQLMPQNCKLKNG